MEQKVILLVEDDFLNRRVSRKVLVENGYRVLESKNAEEALQILTNESVDLVILDINLGENTPDGISLGAHLNDHFPVPFIYLTAYDSPEIIRKAVSTTPFSYLTKPFKNIDLIASVEIAITRSSGIIFQEPSIQVKEGDFHVELPLNAINYIESEGNYLLFHTDDKSYKSRSTIKQMMELLPKHIFVQTHRAYIVNKHKIEKFNTKRIVIKNKFLPLSKTFLNGLLPEK